MHEIDDSVLEKYCLSAGVTTDSGTPGQRFLKFSNGTRRTIVVHVLPTEPDYIRELLRRVLAADQHWLVVPRTKQPLFGIEWSGNQSSGIACDDSDAEALIENLLAHMDGLWSVNNDLWVVSSNATAILSWDHHMIQEGINVYLNDVKTSTQLLCSLNELGAELELYYQNV